MEAVQLLQRLNRVISRFSTNCLQTASHFSWYTNYCQLFVSQKVWSIEDGSSKTSCINCQERAFWTAFFAKLSFLICDCTRFCARRSNKEFLQVNRAGTGTIQSEDFRRHPAFRRVLCQSVCKVSFPPWFTCKLLVQVSIPMVNIYSLSTANNIANHLQWTTMWSWTLSEINVGYLWIGRLKLVKITFVYSYFLVKKCCLWWKIVSFVWCSQDRFYHYIILCTAAVCRQIMLAKTIWYLFQSNRGEENK